MVITNPAAGAAKLGRVSLSLAHFVVSIHYRGVTWNFVLIPDQPWIFYLHNRKSDENPS